VKKPELLAPAGDIECFYAAINAGADAIYLGGSEYGARAYASNFSEEELIEAISYAHLYSVRIYLTVNTLVKEREFDHLVEFLAPLYEAGLDGVIVQDLGAFMEIKEHFPGLELHGSTQMCITSKYGANELKKLGACRVVPARELSLEEIIEIKQETGLEIETFIHGAMCYCYSGQCLFSSFLGGRSGNRGRCAGPCRLPYSYELADDKSIHLGETYPLSLKDMCTISLLPELIDAGIDSFKIEGRMKNPYYVAGVVSIYRKYIDLYCDLLPYKKDFKIDKKDYDLLKKLYIRSDLLDGYYKRHNGKDMITMSKPGYLSENEMEFSNIKENYLDKNIKLPLSITISLRVDEPIYIEISYKKNKIGVDESDVINTLYYSSDFVVTKALKKPLSEEDVKKQMKKTGNTPFYFENISVIIDKDCFVSVKELNDCRRDALLLVKNDLLDLYYEAYPDTNVHTRRVSLNINDDLLESSLESNLETHDSNNKQFIVSIMTFEQLGAVLDYLLNHKENAFYKGTISSIVIDWELLLKKDIFEFLDSRDLNISFYVSLPAIGRKRAMKLLDRIDFDKAISIFDGFYCNQLDDYGYLSDLFQAKGVTLSEKDICGDAGLYLWNHKTKTLHSDLNIKRNVVSLELSHYEYEDLVKACEKKNIQSSFEYFVYGHIPFMQTANCLKKSFDLCDHKQGFTYIKDRYGKELPVFHRCSICENTIFNSVPLSLHDEVDLICADFYRISFTIETRREIEDVLNCFLDGAIMPSFEYTKGHYKKGIQ